MPKLLNFLNDLHRDEDSSKSLSLSLSLFQGSATLSLVRYMLKISINKNYCDLIAQMGTMMHSTSSAKRK
jgi:hypothetical protein